MLEFVDHLAIPRVLEWGIGPTDAERERYAPLDGQLAIGVDRVDYSKGL